MPTPIAQHSTSDREGSKRLALSISNWLSCVAFPSLYLISVFVGASWDTALIRGVVGAIAVRLIGPWLFYLLVDAVLSAITESRLHDSEGDEL